MAIQLATGLLLAFQYRTRTRLSFPETLALTQSVNSGWLIRIIHANGARLFFICLYLHLGRGIYFFSFKLIETWRVGVGLLLVVIATAFLGYVLPWGQISFWGATVITSLLTAIPYIGGDIVLWLWGEYSVSGPTLTRFFGFHFLAPFVASALVVIHLIFLHETGSNNPLGVNSNHLKLPLYPYFILKDFIGFSLMTAILLIVVCWAPWDLGDPENFLPANPLIAPTHIQPEWYFLFAYAILRSIPNKLGGVIALVASVVILYLPLAWPATLLGAKYYKIYQIYFWLQVRTCGILTWIGACPVEAPYILLGQITSCYYFLFFILAPILNNWQDKIIL